MDNDRTILSQDTHRPYPIPSTPWKYYQEWHDVIFVHWQVQENELRKLLPEELELDTFDGIGWVSLVAFTVNKLHPRFFPAFTPFSNFHEINIRTYVKKNGKPGIYFFSIEAEKISSVMLAKLATGLPYTKSDIKRRNTTYTSFNCRDHHTFSLEYTILPNQLNDPLDKWLTERYCIFHDIDEKIFSHDVHHREWRLQEISIATFDTNYCFGELSFHDRRVYRAHFSKGVNVLTWAKQKS